MLPSCLHLGSDAAGCGEDEGPHGEREACGRAGPVGCYGDHSGAQCRAEPNQRRVLVSNPEQDIHATGRPEAGLPAGGPRCHAESLSIFTEHLLYRDGDTRPAVGGQAGCRAEDPPYAAAAAPTA